MKVTVTETIEHSADITAEMVRQYFTRKGAVVIVRRANDWEAIGYGAVGNYVFVDCGEFVSERAAAKIIERIALLENRKPHDVLADVAGEK